MAIQDVTKRNNAVVKYKESIKSLEQINEQLDQFVHVASHDLQEPLRKILTFSNLVKSKARKHIPEEMLVYLEKIEESSKRMSTLIQDLLDYSRVAEQEKLIEKIDLNKVIEDVLPDFELLLEENGRKIEVGKLPEIRAVPIQMRQLFYNLISNALKFSKKEGKPLIQISSHELSMEKLAEHKELNSKLRHAEIIVKDNGIGFDQKYGEKIFTIFQRLNTTREYKGTGIGLAMVKRVVENHKGKVIASSTPGEGATFHIFLPLEGEKEVSK